MWKHGRAGTRTYKKQGDGREDPTAALRADLARTIAIVGKEEAAIETGKVGRTTSTFRPDAHTESTSVDGLSEHEGNAGSGQTLWDVSHDAAAGNAADDTGTNLIARSRHNGTRYSIIRMGLLFDTSTLPDSDNISSATLTLTEHTGELDPIYTDDDGNCYLSVVTANPSANTAITTTDFDAIGDAIDNPTKQSNDVSFNGITNGQAVSWTLNATGISNITKTAVTKFGLREGHDIEDDIINTSSACSGNWSGADFSGTASDPALVVVHAANNAPTAPSGTKAEGQFNPTDVTDNTPEFSAVFHDADATDLALHYRIQVSTSSSFTGTYWDSGTTTISSSTPPGSASPKSRTPDLRSPPRRRTTGGLRFQTVLAPRAPGPPPRPRSCSPQVQTVRRLHRPPSKRKG